MKKEKMRCPSCGIEMNHHADKIDYTVALTEPKTVERELGGIIEEIHTCPGCGTTAVRKAGDQEN